MVLAEDMPGPPRAGTDRPEEGGAALFFKEVDGVVGRVTRRFGGISGAPVGVVVGAG